MSEAKVYEGIDWGNGTDRGYMVVTIGPDPTPESVQAFRDAYDLAAAWAEAEAALPEGWRLYGVQYTGDEPWSLRVWRAWAGLVPYGEDENPYRASVGYTPAAALRALAAKLREMKA